VPAIVSHFSGPKWQIEAIVNDIDRLQKTEPFPLEALENTANWVFRTEKSARSFLTELRAEILKCKPSDSEH
jgi:hypothetical protein